MPVIEAAKLEKMCADIFLGAGLSSEEAKRIAGQGKYAQAQPLFEKALEIYRRLLTEKRGHLELVARTLLEKETILGAELKSLLEKPVPDDGNSAEAPHQPL